MTFEGGDLFSPSMGCQFIVETSGPVRVLRLEGSDFAMPHLAQFRAVFSQIIAADGDRPLAMDTTGLELVGSCCLAGIIDYALGFRKRSLPLFLVENRADILEVFQVASLGAILPIYNSLEEGIRALPPPAPPA